MRIPRDTNIRPSGTLAFTLVEVMFAVGMVGLLLASYFACVNWGLKITRMQRDNLRATQIMVNHLEGIRLFAWYQLTNTSLLPTNFTDYYYPNGSANRKGTEYTGTVSVAPASLSPSAGYSPNMYLITVNLQWTSENQPFSRTMSTYQAMNGMQNYVY